MNDFIGVYQMPAAVTSLVSEAYDALTHMAHEGQIRDETGAVKIDKAIKDANCLGFWSLAGGYEHVAEAYFSALDVCLDQYKLEYPYCSNHHAYWGIVEEANIQVYAPGQGFKIVHWEKTGGPTVNRHLVFMTFLNDIPEGFGGGTEFYHQRRVLQCKAGSTAIWPAEWTHAHRGIVSHSHEKRIVTGWYSYFA